MGRTQGEEGKGEERGLEIDDWKLEIGNLGKKGKAREEGDIYFCYLGKNVTSSALPFFNFQFPIVNFQLVSLSLSFS